MNLEQIKNDYAVKESYRNWNDLLNCCHDGDKNTSLNNHINEVMILAQKECLKRASDNFKQDEYGFKKHYTRIVTNENNILK